MAESSVIAPRGFDGAAGVHLVSETRAQGKRDRLLWLPEVKALTGVKKSTI